MSRRHVFAASFLAALDADPALAAHHHRSAEELAEAELRRLRGPWTAAVLAALGHAAIAAWRSPSATHLVAKPGAGALR
jgi:hypothetical protein